MKFFREMITYSFRDPAKSFQFAALHPKVQEHFFLVAHILNCLGFKVDITSMVRPANSIPGESNVHATGRAIDFVPVVTKDSGPITTREMDYIADVICQLYPRADGKKPILWHELNGGGLHFHVQAQYSLDYMDLKGIVPQD